ncbi:amino acid transporter-like protein [Labilithrix luteola]|uniref:Amino acid transporter-like protein n=1 Tax=Labilithrix luteola TaxID=1391654 RepID=A0A0K1PJ85_9BACT|nr:APC family permease [Labilithrix luteola]AKU93461.1 amino acid transporter-like protein [Labilithrix luteola]
MQPRPGRLRLFLFGPPKDIRDPHAFHKLSLVAILAWVGLGADGLSSSAYGPDEAFRALGEHTGLAFFLALATAATVFIISYGYSRIIEQFPSGGGGYVVASKLLSPTVGVVSGSALLVDYVLTITISIASGADAVFSFLPPSWASAKLPVAFTGIAILTVMNIRGVKESVTSLLPIFGLFLLTHAVLLGVAIGGHLGDVGNVVHEVRDNIGHSSSALGAMGALALFVRAYSMGGGTYTGIEAVSNGVAMMREPRVSTAKRTMVLMAVSLAVTAGGILLSYLLVHARAAEGKTMNAVLLENVAGHWQIGGLHVGSAFVILTLVTEGTLLFVAAQAGFLDGPRVMANMATDSWLPHRFAALSDRLSMRNGVMLMALAAFAALTYTHGDVSKLVVMYSINVFVTFSLSNLAMARFWIRHRSEHPGWGRHLVAHGAGLLLCVTILAITVVEKFLEGGWVTLLVTAGLVALCFVIKRHYGKVVTALRKLDEELPSPAECDDVPAPPKSAAFLEGATEGLLEHHPEAEPDPTHPVAILMVGGYSGLGRHALLTLLRMFPNHFQGIIFVSVAVVDSESFKGQDQIALLEKRTRENLLRYERYAQHLGLRSASAFAIGTEVAVEVEKTAGDLVRRYPKALFVAGQLIFEEDTLFARALHNETAFMVQKRLQRRGIPMIVVPVRVDLEQRKTVIAPRDEAATSAKAA